MSEYEVWIEEYDGANEWRKVGEHFDEETAAIEAGERYDNEGDYILVSDASERITVHVREVGTTLEFKFRVGCQMEPNYNAVELC